MSTNPSRFVIEGVPSLEWGKSGDTTFCGALAAALSPMADRSAQKSAPNLVGPAYDYAALMGVSGLSFRVRWFRSPGKQKWSGACAIGEQLEERELVGAAIGKRLSAQWLFGDANPKRQHLIADIVSSIDGHQPVLSYVAPHLDMAVVYGYQDDGRTLLVRDYYPGPDSHPAAKVGGFYIFLKDALPALSPRDALVSALSAALRNFARTDHPAFAEQAGSQFFYGREGYDTWIEDIAQADQFAVADRRRLFDISNWNFNILCEARSTATAYLQAAAEYVDPQSRAALLDAAAIYRQQAEMLRQARKTKNLFVWPSAMADVAKWTKEVRNGEMAVLQQSRQLDENAIAKLREGLAAMNPYSLRPFAQSDWKVLPDLANAALPENPAGNQKWLEARQKLDEKATPRRHYIVEDRRTDKAVAYGAIEADPITHRARIFLVGSFPVLCTAADTLMRQLNDDAHQLGASVLWAREYEQDMAVQAIFSQQGFLPRQSITPPGDATMILLERPLLPTTAPVRGDSL